MKKRSILCVLLLAAGLIQAQTIKSKTYSTGVYIFSGTELPKKFEYVIERKAANEAEYKTIASLKAPGSEADCKGRLMSLPASIAANTKIEPLAVSRVWQQCYRNAVLDSLYAYAMDPRYQYAAGCAFFDDGLAAGTYTYRVSKKDRSDNLTMLKEERIVYPSAAYNGTAKAVRFKPEESSVIIHYALTDTLSTAGLKIYRSKHKENNYSEIPASLSFMQVNKQTVAQVIDATAAKGITYSYVAIPFDALGNMGRAGDTLNIYNMSKAGDIGMVQSFAVKALEEKKGIELSWKLNTDAALTSIELFRGSTYEGTYEKIASVSPRDTSYLDADKSIKPATSYFYYLVANASYGRSFPSARTPAILKGNNPNILPPQNVNITRNGNVVTLSFRKAEPDTRGYYVYRARGYAGELVQLQKMLLTEDSAAIFMDTLPLSDLPQVYSYAVADVNTSYNISPVSDRVSIQTSGVLPVVSGVTAMLNGNHVFVTWKDATRTNPAVGGYNIYRSAIKPDGSQAEAAMVMATLDRDVNSYTDSSVQEGLRYRYQVQTTGSDQDVSALSQWASINIGIELPLQPGQVLAYASDKKAVIKWDLPGNDDLAKIRIYRASPGIAAALLKEVSATSTSFEDASIQTGKTYYYMITSVNKAGRESEMTDAVSVKLR